MTPGQAAHLPRQARLREDPRARRRGGGGAGRGAVRHPGAPRHAAALGPAARARRRPGLVGDPQRDPRRPRRQPAGGPHRGPSARVPGLPRQDPGRRVRGGHHDDLGPGHVRDPPVGGEEGRGHLPRRAPVGPLRAVPDWPAGPGGLREGLDDPPHGPAGRPRPRADAGADPADAGRRRGASRARLRAGPSRSSGTGCARSPTSSRAACAWRAATSTRSPRPTPRCAGCSATSGCARRCSTGRSWPSAMTGGRASSASSGACTSPRPARCAACRPARPSSTPSSTCSTSTGTP